MQNEIRLDSHKLMFHPDRVAKWLKGENIYPIEVEISPSGACNHRCSFCAVDYVGYKTNYLDKDVLLKNLRIMKEKGLKSVICSGEGEPLLNRQLPEIVNEIKKLGIDVAMSTNGVYLTPEVTEQCLKAFTWIRFSVASVKEATYRKVQRGKDGDLETVLSNIRYAAEYKKKQGCEVTLGVQCLLLPENLEELCDMAYKIRELGVDYFTIKPYSQHTQSKNHLDFDYERLANLDQELKECETEEFRVYFRHNAMKQVHHKKQYTECWGLPFMAHIDAEGNVWPCVNFIGQEGFCYGNIYEATFDQLWGGGSRRAAVEKMKKADINGICREACRLDSINRYLDELKHPGGHVNFI